MAQKDVFVWVGTGLNDGPNAEWTGSPTLSAWPAGVERANRTFYRLLNTPLRKQLWVQYGASPINPTRFDAQHSIHAGFANAGSGQQPHGGAD